MEPPPELDANRVSVIDASDLDSEIYSILKTSLLDISKSLPPVIFGRYEPEIEALLKLFIWKMSVESANSTFGQRVLQLNYGSTSMSSLRKLAALNILGSYLNNRSTSFVSFIQNYKISFLVRKLFSWSETTFSILNIVSFLYFLKYGGSHSFIERLLRIKPMTNVKPSSRSIGYSYMTRELVWHGFIELLAFVIPLVNYHALKRRMRRYFYKGNEGAGAEGVAALTLDSKCAVCNESPILPHTMGCPHVFCYYCLSANREADIEYECPACSFSNTDPRGMIPLSALQTNKKIS